MSKQDVLVEALDTEAQFLWTASGDSIVGESADLWCAYTGQREEEIQNWGWIKALHPDDRERARHLWTQAAQHKRFYETWYRIRNAKDEYQTFLIRHMPILQKDGTIREWVSQPSTTERLLHEPDNWQANQLHQLFVEQTSIGMAYVSLDGRYLNVNARFCAMVGYSREELLARNIKDITHPEDIETNRAILDQQLAGSLSSYVFEKRYIRKDGATIWVKITGLLLRLPSAQPLCFFGLIEDITEERQKERRVQQALNDLLTIVEEVSRLPIQSDDPGEAVPVPSLHAVEQTLTEIIHQVLQCRFVACNLHEPKTGPQPGKLHLAGVSGLTIEEEHIYRQEIEQSFDSDYLDTEYMAHLYANEVVVRDLLTRPFVKLRSDFGAPYRMVAPMVLNEQLVGTLVIAKVEAGPYTPEEIALVKAIARLIVQVIERARLLNEWTATRAAEEEQKRLLELERAASAAERRNKQEVAALTHQLRAVFEAMTDGVVFRDVEGRLLLINAAGYRLMEVRSKTDFIEKPYPDFYALYEVSDEHRRPLSAEQWPMSRILHGEVLSSEQAVDVMMHLPSGREVQYSYSGAPVYDRGGQMIGGVCVFRDVTEVRQKERRVQQALNDLLTIVEEVSRLPIQSEEPSEATPLQPRYLYTVGRNLTEIIRRVLQCCFVGCLLYETELGLPNGKIHVAGVSGLTAEEEQIFRKEAEQSIDADYLAEEDIARLRANEVVILDLVARPFVKQRTAFGRYGILAPMMLDDQALGLLIVGGTETQGSYTQEEIALVKAIAKLVLQVIERARLLNEWTAARANELALQEVNRRFDAFLSIASHELRTPLTTIKGNVQLALRRMNMLKTQYAQQFAKLESAEQLMSAFERMHQPLQQAVQRTQVQERMISDLLDASRIRANKLELRMHPCDLAQIVRQTVEDLHYFASDRVIHIHLPESRPVPIMADADRIGQVVNNYLVNAIRYSSSDRPVEVSLELIEEGKTARVVVRDQGSGIAPEDLNRIWERFYRSHETRSQYDAGAGLGLGLYISHTIIERHGGHVGVESIQGEGSTFWFTLPLS